MDDLRPQLDFAHRALDQSRALIARLTAAGFEHRLKADRSFVTDADLAVEQLLREAIHEAWPAHGILGEEFEVVHGDAEWLWVIDPIDGTHSFRHGVPLYGTLLALCHRGIPVVGAIDLPGIARRVAGAVGCGVVADGVPIHPAGSNPLGPGDSIPIERGDTGFTASPAPIHDLDPDLEGEIIATGERKQFVRCGRAAQFDRLMAAHGSVRTYCDAFGHALTLTGALGACVDVSLKPWDVAASWAIARAAGMRFELLGGPPVIQAGAEYDVVFGRARVVDWVLQVTGDVGPEAG